MTGLYATSNLTLETNYYRETSIGRWLAGQVRPMEQIIIILFINGRIMETPTHIQAGKCMGILSAQLGQVMMNHHITKIFISNNTTTTPR
jgi:hypothetical protein